jgi:predicted GIY-YIG superfamily endonuclease
MVNYQNGKIYKIIFSNTDDLYVGSTCQPLKDRLSQHKRQKDNKKTIEAFKTNTNIKIVLVEKYPCIDKEELIKREQYWMDELEPSINSINACQQKSKNPFEFLKVPIEKNEPELETCKLIKTIVPKKIKIVSPFKEKYFDFLLVAQKI